ncbi:MAG: PTS glucose transporter subunit IIA [Propionibacteriaceae bacterium]|nr:PTS glucose transporter subunit IIA [Propionibacteriaceae bacterium]
MPTSHTELGKRVIELVGGPDNVRSVYHCQTRLRFTLCEDNRADAEALNGTDGVVSALSSGGVFQVVIGMHVKEIYDQIEAILPQTNQPSKGTSDPAAKRGVKEVFLDVVSGTFQQVAPPLVAAGMIIGLQALLLLTGIIEVSSPVSAVLSLIGNGIFYLLPVLVAFAAADKLECNRLVAAASAAVLLYASWASEQGQVDVPRWTADYQAEPFLVGASLTTVVLMVVSQAYVERFLNKVVPASLRLALVPMLTVVVVAGLGITAFAAAGSFVDTYLVVFLRFLATTAAWLPAMLIGAFLPLLVMRGLHQAVAACAVLQIALIGVDSFFGPGALVSNFAQATAAGVMALRSRDRALLPLAVAMLLTAVLTITLGRRVKRTPSVTPAAETKHPAADPTARSSFSSPCNGTLVALDQVKDPVFSTGAMGPGVGVEPSDGTILAPCSGTVLVAMNTGHAFGIRNDDGVEVLVHVGIDTVAMNGKGFTGAVAKGTRVEEGQVLVHADLEAITQAGHPATVILIVTNHAKTGTLTPCPPGPVRAGERVFTVARKPSESNGA